MNVKKGIVLLGIANLITAFGGGAVLGSSIKIISISFIDVSSLLAFFVGTLLGLLFLFKPSLIKNTEDWLLPIFGSLSSCVLFYLLYKYSDSSGRMLNISGLFFFIVLSLRFSFWFLSRIVRSDTMSTYSKSSVPFIEGLFHLGTIISLVLFALGFIKISLYEILIVDVIAQLISAVFDKIADIQEAELKKDISKKQLKSSSLFKKELIILVLLLSISTFIIQVSYFHFVHMLPHRLGLISLAVFYLGLAVAGIYCTLGGVDFIESNHFGLIRLNYPKEISLNNLMVLSISVFSMLLGYGLYNDNQIFMCMISFFLGTISYEIFALSLINKISEIGEINKVTKSVAKSFAVMALFAVCGLFSFSLFQVNIEGLVIVSFFGFFLCVFLLRSFLMNRKLKEVVDG